METEVRAPMSCKQCRKEIKTEIVKYMPCTKIFHPSCHRLHKVLNSANELVPCLGKFEVCNLKGGEINEIGKLKSKDSRESILE